jgi:hypothetical protein
MDLTTIASSPAFTVLCGLCTIFSTGIAFYFYFRSKERFALSYSVSEKKLIQASTLRPFDMNVPLSWNGHDVTRLTRSFILIQNTGNKLVQRTDIVGIPSVQVGEGSTIIDAGVIFADDAGSKVSLKESSINKRAFDLEFLRQKDGFILKIDHTGSLNELFVECKTMAGGSIKKINQTARVVIGLLIAVPMLCFLGNVIWRNVELPEPFGRKIANGDLLFDMVGSFFIGALALLGFVIVAGLIALLLSLLTKGTLTVNKRANLVFADISNNKKGSLTV